MESSSDDSFAWVNASSDSCHSDAMAAEDVVQNSDEESESGQLYKKKLQKRLLDNEINDSNRDEIQQKSKKRKIKEESLEKDSPKKKRIKIEPESDVDVRNKSKYKNSVNEIEVELYDKSYLNKLVKEEEATFATPTPKKQKKKEKRESVMSSNLDDQYSENSHVTKPKKSKKQKRNVDPHTTDEGRVNGAVENIHANHEIHATEDADMSTSKKKKSKKKKREPSLQSEIVDMIIEDKFSAEETVVMPHWKNHKQETYTERSQNSNTNNDIIPTQTIHNSRLSIHDIKSRQIINLDSSDESSTPENFAIRQKSTQNSILHNNANISTENNKVNINDKNDNSYTNSQSNSLANNDFSLCDKTSTRTTRISDRLRFEEDEDLEIESSQSHNDEPIQQSPFKRFLTSNPNLKPILPQGQCLITNDNENFILKCPSGLNIEVLKNTELVIDTKCKVKITGQTYEGCLNENINSVPIVSYENNKFSLYNLPLNGTVCYRKRIPKPHFIQDNVMVNNQTNFIPLPETKCRHPLFGPHYKSLIKLPAEKKKKRHKREKECEHETELTPPSHKLKRKRKHSYHEEVSPIKCKRPKHDPSSPEVWESKKAIEKTLFNHF